MSANVPADVIGEPETEKPVGTVIPTEVTVPAPKPSDDVAVHTGALEPFERSTCPAVPAFPLNRSAPVMFASPATVRRWDGVVVPIPTLPEFVICKTFVFPAPVKNWNPPEEFGSENCMLPETVEPW